MAKKQKHDDSENTKARGEREEREWLERIRLKQREKGSLTRRQLISLLCKRVKRLMLSDAYFESVLFSLIEQGKIRVASGMYYVDDPGNIDSARMIENKKKSTEADPRQLSITGVESNDS